MICIGLSFLLMPTLQKLIVTTFCLFAGNPGWKFCWKIFRRFLDLQKRSKNFGKVADQRAPNPPEFAQPRLSRVKARSSPTKGYKFGCVCSYIAGHEDARVVTGDIGTNTPKLVPSRWGWPRFDPTKRGCTNSGGFGARWAERSMIFCKTFRNRMSEMSVQFPSAEAPP